MKSFLLLLAGFTFAVVAIAATPEPADTLEGQFKVEQVIQQGVLVSGYCEKEPKGGINYKFQAALLTGAKDKVEGDFFYAGVRITGTFTYTDTFGASRTVRKYALVKDRGN